MSAKMAKISGIIIGRTPTPFKRVVMPYVQESYLAFLALAAVNALHNIDLTDVDGFHSLNR
jgi:hypothetical protein